MFGFLSFLTPALGPLGAIFKSKWVWIGLLIASLAGFGYWQTTRYIEQSIQNEQLRNAVEESEAARVKLLQDIERMNDINQGLEDDKKAAQARINVLSGKLADALGAIVSANTPEETAAVSVKIEAMTNQSYECIEAASGKVGAKCEQ